MSKLPLSEAIRLGSMLRQQAFGEYTRVPVVKLMGQDIEISEGLSTCAISAALEAVGAPLDEDWQFDRTIFHELALAASCPECGACEDGWCLDDVIPHLNDDHRWTREAIAGWVESIIPVREEVSA